MDIAKTKYRNKEDRLLGISMAGWVEYGQVRSIANWASYKSEYREVYDGRQSEMATEVGAQLVGDYEQMPPVSTNGVKMGLFRSTQQQSL